MQISSGWAKGMRLMTPRGDGTRPTAAKVRAAALNMLMPVLPGSRFLDLFAGSGGMGLEAVSRGASAAFFVDKAPPALAALRQNVAELTRRAQAQGLTVPHLSV
ncbi:RsmD family RNA methyltransferase, partial [Enterococcus faecium]|uniref:RsmD family RNA methyltransferase n=1 Tax=Enterococcus faecium TaxID=1352 RepID=UPI003AAD2C3C